MTASRLSPYVQSFILPTIVNSVIRQSDKFTSTYIADVTGYSPRHAYNFLRELESAGLVSRAPRGRRWQLTIRPVQQKGGKDD